MFKRASSITKRAQRHGKGTKMLFRIQVHKVTFPRGTSISADAEVSVCFERGGKISSSNDRNVAFLDDGTIELFCYESLSLVATIYKDSSGAYLEKTGKIIVRQKKKKSRLMTEGYKGLGVVSLALHDIATTYQSVEKAMELQQCSVTGAMIEFVIIPKIIGETDAMFDDTMSCQSGFSDNSMLEAADFDDFNKSAKKIGQLVPREEPVQGSPGADNKTGAGGSSLGVQLTEALSSKQLLEQKLNDLDSNYNSVCDENERLRQSVKASQNETLTLQESMEDLSEQVHSLENAGQHAEDKYKELQQKETEAQRALLAAQEAIKEGEARREELQTQLKSKVVENESQATFLLSLRDELEASATELQRAKSVNSSQSNQIEAISASCKDMENKTIALQGDLQRKEDADASKSARIAELESLFEKKTVETDSVRSEVAVLEGKVKSLEKGAAASQEDMNGERAKIAMLQASLTKKEEECTSKAASIESLQRDLELKSTELASVNDANSLRCGEMVSRIAALQADIESRDRSAAARDERVTELEASLQKQTSLTEAGSRDVFELQTKLDSLKEQLSAAINSGKAEKAKSTALLAEKDAACRELKQSLYSLENDIVVKTNEMKALQDSNNDQLEQIEALRSTNKDMKGKFEELKADIEAREKDAAASAERVADLEARLLKQTSLTEDSSREMAQVVAEHKSQKHALEASAEALSSQLEEQKQEAGRLRVVEANLTEDVSSLTKKVVALTSDIHEMEATVMATNSTGEEKLTAVLASKMELEERHAATLAENEASLAVQREHEETIRSLKADLTREATLEKTRNARIVSENEDLKYELSIITEKLCMTESQLEESISEVDVLIAKKREVEKLYNEKVQQGSSDESVRSENLELASQLKAADEKHQRAMMEAQEEISELIATVVESKLNAATHATEVDEVKQKMKALKQRMQVYAQRVATLEVAVAEANAGPTTEEDSSFASVIRRYFK